jgi:Myotubularin-like phosphatase domain
LDSSSRDNNSTGFYSKLEESGWLKHVRLIMKAGVLAAEKLHLEGECGADIRHLLRAEGSTHCTVLYCIVTYYSEPYCLQVCLS